MSKGGSPPTSNAAKEAAGTYRPCTERRELRLKPQAPKMPAVVRENKHAREEWERIVPELDEAKLLSRVDEAGLTTYCLYFAKMAAGGLGRDGLTNGDMTHFRQLLTEFGMTPRSRLMTPPIVDDPANSYVNDVPWEQQQAALERAGEKVATLFSRQPTTPKASLQEKSPPASSSSGRANAK